MKKPHPYHIGDPVDVGPYTVLVGGYQDLLPEDLEQADILVALTSQLPEVAFGKEYRIIAAPLRDFGGVPNGWEQFLEERIIPLLAERKKLLAYCGASHGRTGTFLGSLIALLESRAETPDPIEAVRERHCRDAVETLEQAEAIFAIRGERLPEKYQHEFSMQRLYEEAKASRGLLSDHKKLR